MDSTAPVVVGVDGSANARVALRWAADWAELHGRPLHLVGAQEVSAHSAQVHDKLTEDLKAWLLVEVAGVTQAHPGLPVTVEVRLTTPAAAMVEASESATAVVLGCRGMGAWESLLVGSVSAATIAHSRCPVVVVPPQRLDNTATGAVVLGIDGSSESHAAADFAFTHAARTGQRLVAVYAWEMPLRLGVSVLGGSGLPESTDDDASQRAFLADALEGHAQAHPEVTVEQRVVPGSAGQVLAELSKTASIVVVGSRGRGGFRGLLLGSVSRDLVQTTKCPVAVVRSPAARPTEPAPAG